MCAFRCEAGRAAKESFFVGQQIHQAAPVWCYGHRQVCVEFHRHWRKELSNYLVLSHELFIYANALDMLVLSSGLQKILISSSGTRISLRALRDDISLPMWISPFWMRMDKSKVFLLAVSYMFLPLYANCSNKIDLDRFTKFKTRKWGVNANNQNQCLLGTLSRGKKVTSLGVLFDFTGNDHNTTVQKVEDMVKEAWVSLFTITQLSQLISTPNHSLQMLLKKNPIFSCSLGKNYSFVSVLWSEDFVLGICQLRAINVWQIIN